MVPTTCGPLTIVDCFVRALGDGRLDDAQGLLHDDLVVTEAGGLPFSGEYCGARGFVELLSEITKYFELMLGPTIEYLSTGQMVAMRGRMTFTSRTSGRSVEIGLVELFEVRHGLIVDLDIYYKDPTAVASLLA